jgi:hypothetical protein
VPAEKAWAAGLLHHGDTHVLVGTTEASRLRQFYEFYLEASERKRQKNIDLLKLLLHRSGRLAYEQYMIDDMKDGWLLAQYNRMPPQDARRFEVGSRDTPSKAWWDDRRWEAPRSDQEDFIRPSQSSNELLRDFPTFKLMIMFRICGATTCDSKREVDG